VDADDGLVAFPVRDLATLQALRHVLLTSSSSPASSPAVTTSRPGGGSGDDDHWPLTMELRGEPLTLVSVDGSRGGSGGRGGSLSGNNAALRRALERQTTVPCQLVFKNRQTPSIGNDHVRKTHVYALFFTKKHTHERRRAARRRLGAHSSRVRWWRST
jgi:hypothetical protein